MRPDIVFFEYSPWRVYVTRVYVTRVYVTISSLRYDFWEIFENCELKTLLNSIYVQLGNLLITQFLWKMIAVSLKSDK